eukprot:gene18011-24421_t
MATAVQQLQQPQAVAAENDRELFDIFDEKGRHIGTEHRGVVHKNGIFHRAVYCFVFNLEGNLAIQRRSAQKKVGPKQWDLSVAEHLEAGESFGAAALRGLQEELGILKSELPESLGAPVQLCHMRKLDLPEIGIKDYEFVESYQLRDYDGKISFNENEVSEVKWMPLSSIREEMKKNPGDFTTWFREEATALGWLDE